MAIRLQTHVLAVLVGLVLSYAPSPYAQQTGPSQADAKAASQVANVQLFATVNGKPITQNEFHSAYATYLRQKFYHGQVPQDQLDQARKDVTDQLVNRILYQEEIERRGVTADAEDVEKRISMYEQRYATSPAWQKNRESLLPGLREQLGQQSKQARLEQSVKRLPEPTNDEVKAFYLSKPELFTEPAKLRLHTILLAVDPSSPRAAWDAALREGQAIVKRIRGGSSFAEQARLFSKDPSADNGGDLGYLHQGMMPDSLQSKIDSFKLGEVADPIEMLQGIGVFRLDERIQPKLQPFENVAGRARDLLSRDRQEKAWSDLLAKLRAEAKIVLLDNGAAQGEAKTGK